MTVKDKEYYRKRLQEEARRAVSESNPSVRHVHQTLATHYRDRLASQE